ncbi:MAG: NAD-dependent epimerase/dehydratase family protein [Gemmatimonadaceae bacterium]
MTSAHRAIVEQDVAGLAALPLPWNRLDGRTILITGATGLIGGYFAEVLLRRNRVSGSAPTKVIALVRDAGKAAARFADFAGQGDLRVLAHDVTDEVPADTPADFIVHAAGNATPRRFAADPVGTYSAAVLGTHHLLGHAARMDSEAFLLLSSGAVHGAVPGESTVVDERTIGIVDPLDPYACYPESKRMAETMCSAWTRQHGVPTRIARISHSYGPGLRRDDDRAFAEFTYCALDRRDIVLHSDGSAVRPYCYLADVAHALVRLLLSGANGEAYAVANPEAACSVRTLATFIAGLGGVSVRTDLNAAQGSIANRDPKRTVDISKLRGLGWQPRVGYEEGFRRTLQSLA